MVRWKKKKMEGEKGIRRRKEERAESLCKEIIAENFLNLGKKMEIQVHETKRTSNCLKSEMCSSRHII